MISISNRREERRGGSVPFSAVVIASIHYMILTEERNKRPIFVYVNLDDRWALPLLSPSGQTFFPPPPLINASMAALRPYPHRPTKSIILLARMRAIYPTQALSDSVTTMLVDLALGICGRHFPFNSVVAVAVCL